MSWADLDIVGLFANVGCYVRKGYFYIHLYGMTLAPLVFVGLVMFYYFVMRAKLKLAKAGRDQVKDLKRRSWALSLTLIHLSYAPVSFKIFQTFVCEEFDDESDYLMADYSVDCNGEEYAAVRAYAR